MGHIVRIIDFETTGLELPAAEVIEVGTCDVDVENRTVSPPRSWLCGVHAIPPETRAVHHIRMQDVEGCAPFDGRQLMLDMLDDGCFGFGAHNVEYEWQFVAPHVTLPMFCTHKAALRVWPEAPNHQNTTLRYWLEDTGRLSPDFDQDLAMPPHRAGPDAYVTGHVMLALFEAGATGKQMSAWTKQPRLLPKCTIGKFRGVPWPDVEGGFLDWMLKQRDMEEDLKWNARRELDRRAGRLQL